MTLNRVMAVILRYLSNSVGLGTDHVTVVQVRAMLATEM